MSSLNGRLICINSDDLTELMMSPTQGQPLGDFDINRKSAFFALIVISAVDCREDGLFQEPEKGGRAFQVTCC
ncbi:hypothetical protein CEXT_621121 [Caerostris extrusa]|uniref:Uncharacterized protein n=1 Tax=Caerostris extrusa TaxID=172846 RepID=A0AAV4XYB9_CAEEX|nr:hypothetical protein CEXT_621121 [Caerostris extrusa]